MDQNRKTLSRSRSYAFKRMQIHPEKEDKPQKISCLYIGHEFDRVYPFMNGFAITGFSRDFKPAFQTISKLASASSLPSVILVDASLPLADLQPFLAELHEQDFFSRLLIIGETGKCSEQQILALKKEKYIDDLVELNETDLLSRKTLFFQKMKQPAFAMPAARKIETQLSWYKLSLTILQRAFDMLFSMLLLVLFSPFFLLIALLIKIDSAGPVFMISTGRGMRYQDFRFIRFRTTQVQTEKVQDLQLQNIIPDQKLTIGIGESQTTRMGSFLRRTNLDELPSLLNVLLGDISFLGNRIA
jgi:lipopolysaccharide/colanic/teichoic acid biosynthesis glycosyltransferase